MLLLVLLLLLLLLLCLSAMAFLREERAGSETDDYYEMIFYEFHPRWPPRDYRLEASVPRSYRCASGKAQMDERNRF